ncbi:MAG: AAA family ATPase [Gemmiger sp.]
MEHILITLGREYASGGSEIAQKAAELMNIPLYNKELITRAAKKSGLTEEAIAASESRRSGSLIYNLYMMGNTLPLADQVYILQSNVIRELAQEGPCVILGRCGDYVLRDSPNVLKVFVYAPLDDRIARARERAAGKDQTDRQWEAEIAKHDRARASYYNYYTENRWGEAKHYDLCLNSALGVDACAELIVRAADALKEKLEKAARA